VREGRTYGSRERSERSRPWLFQLDVKVGTIRRHEQVRLVIILPLDDVKVVIKAVDIFETSTLDGDLSYTKDVKDQYTRLDFGFVGGAGYKFKKLIKSMAVGISYYYGLVNVSLTPDVTMKNSSLNFYMKIPIGIAPKPEKP